MTYDPSNNNAVYRYKKSNIKRISLDVQKDYFDDVIRPAADYCNVPVNRFIKDAISHFMDYLDLPFEKAYLINKEVEDFNRSKC